MAGRGYDDSIPEESIERADIGSSTVEKVVTTGVALGEAIKIMEAAYAKAELALKVARGMSVAANSVALAGAAAVATDPQILNPQQLYESKIYWWSYEFSSR